MNSARDSARVRPLRDRMDALIDRLAEAGAELARIDGRAPATGNGLTPTERQVADLVVAGLSNREVADRLSVTVRTVESNLTRVYQKLDIRSRSQLARRLDA